MQKQTHPLPAFDWSEMIWALQCLQLPTGFQCVASGEVMLTSEWGETDGVMGRSRELSQSVVRLESPEVARWQQ